MVSRVGLIACKIMIFGFLPKGNDGVIEQVTVFKQERFYGNLKPFRSKIVAEAR